jgi:hypothetical protein
MISSVVTVIFESDNGVSFAIHQLCNMLKTTLHPQRKKWQGLVVVARKYDAVVCDIFKDNTPVKTLKGEDISSVVQISLLKEASLLLTFTVTSW